jgi:hypothetical protein
LKALDALALGQGAGVAAVERPDHTLSIPP